MNTTTSSHFVPPTRFEIFDPLNQISTMWEESFKNNGGGFYTPNSIIIPTNQKPYSLVTLHICLSSLVFFFNSETNGCLCFQSEDGTEGTPHKFDQEASTSRHPDKVSCIIAHLNFFGALCEFIIFLYPQTQRRLAQNREAAKKSRLRKKVWYFYVPLQQLMKYLCFCFVKTEFWSLVLSGLCSAARDKPVEANSLRARTWSC